MDKKFDRLISLVSVQKATDLYLSPGNYPAIRIDGRVNYLEKEALVDRNDLRKWLESFLSEKKIKMLDDDFQVDFSLEYNQGTQPTRFRGNAFFQKGNLSVVLRLIPDKIKKLGELNLPETIYNFVEKSQGLLLIVGPTGHGKSTTLASLIDYLNSRKAFHIVTIEDPIEYIHSSKKSLVEQREILQDANNFKDALRACFRESADVILVGEMRDLETISIAMTAAETGHLVLATLHTNDAVQTVDRIVDVFPPYQQNQIRYQLSNVLLGVVSQRLIQRTGGGMIPAVEILIGNRAVSNLIRQNQTNQIPSVIETSLAEGMIDINRSLSDLVRKGEISLEDAKNYSTDINSLNLFLSQ